MEIETDPRLWADPLWSRLARAQLALRDRPQILFEKDHDWEDGLNAKAINRRVLSTKTSAKRVYETLAEKDGSVVVARRLRVNHPGAPPPVEALTWHRYSPVVLPATAVERIVAYLEAWMDARAAILLPKSDATTLAPRPPAAPAGKVTRSVVAELSLTERRVIWVLHERHIDVNSLLRPSQRDIGRWVGRKYNSGLKNTLSAMVKAEWIGSRRKQGERGGYYLAPRGAEACKWLHRS